VLGCANVTVRVELAVVATALAPNAVSRAAVTYTR
jgi:hypothetical protein